MTFAAREENAYTGQPVELYKFETPAQTFFYTSAEETQTYAAQDYEPLPGLSRSGISQNRSGKRNDVNFIVPHDCDVALYFKTYTPFEEMILTIYRNHRTDVEYAEIWSGSIAIARFDYPKATLIGKPWDGQRQQPILAVTHQHKCNWNIYDDLCGLNPSIWGASRTIDSISSDSLTLTLNASITGSDYYRGGILRFGSNNIMIKEHDTTTVTVLTAVQDLVVGSSVLVLPSCMGDRDKCTSTFSNLERFFGFDVPTKDIYGPDGFKGNI